MKSHAVVLGEYGTPPVSFCVYQLGKDCQEPRLFLCLQDIDALIFSLTEEKGRAALYRIHHCFSDQIYKNDHDGAILMSFNAVAELAHRLCQFTLAELCQLSLAEFLGGVAAPLLPTQSAFKAVTPYLTMRTVIPTVAGDVSQWLVSVRASNPVREPHPSLRDEQRLSQFMQQLSHHPLWQGVAYTPRRVDQELWQKVSRWFGDYDATMPAYMLSTVQARKQQQSIIASRQRRACLQVTASVSPKLCNNTVKKRKSNVQILPKHYPARPVSPPPPPPQPQPPSIRQHTDLPPTPLTHWSSSPPPWSPARACPTNQALQLPLPKPTSSRPRSPDDDPYRAWLPPPWSSQRKPSTRSMLDPMPRKWASWSFFHHYTDSDSQDDVSMGSPNSGTSHNLDLLATQATRRQPILTPRIQLPSPSEMLSRRPPSGIV